jgi:hypothetical protein
MALEKLSTKVVSGSKQNSQQQATESSILRLLTWGKMHALQS